MDDNFEFEDISSSSNKTPESFKAPEQTAKFDKESTTDTKTQRFFAPSFDGSFIIGDDEMPRTNEAVSLNNFTHKKSKKKLKQKILALNIIVSTLLVLSLIVTSVMGAAIYLTGDANYSYIPDDHGQLGIDKDIVETLDKDIINIALFGLDSRSRDTTNRKKPLSGLSDSIIILSVNTNNNTVKLTSLLRDSWVPIEGHGYQKLNAAYSKGGAALALKTINKNYGLNITDYVAVSLHQLWKVIDFMGGIDIMITEAERKELNYLSNSEGFGVNKLEKSGLVHLDGGQAMTYARIRKIDGEPYRALRQQKVMNCLFEKAKSMPVSKYPGLLKNMMTCIETSLDYSEIIKFTPLLSGGNLTLESRSIPGDDVIAKGGIFEDTRGGWVWKYDLNEAKRYIHKWVYDID